MKTILITGGAGFIGSHITEAYLAKGWQVAVVDDFSSGTWENLSAVRTHPNLHVYEQDICDLPNLKRIFAEVKPQVVNHHAAQKSVADSVVEPLRDQEINGKGFLQVLLCAIENQVENIVYVSSGGALSKEIHGEEQSAETDLPQLISPYAIHKYAGEKYLEMYARIHGFSYTILRYANVYGPRQIPDGECGVIPIFINNVLADRESVLYTYEDMPRGCSRDYVHVADVVKANILAEECPCNTALNIGTGQEVYIRDIYEMIAKAFDSSASLRVAGPREGDIRRSVLNVDKAKKVLGWEPTIGLEEGLRALSVLEKSKKG